MSTRVGFAVIYRWRLRPGCEESFVTAWAAMTRAIRERHGGLGSRLHRDDDGTWVAYAQWPDRATWQAAQAAQTAQTASAATAGETEAAAAMGEAIAERFAPVLLHPVDDLLVSG